MTLTVTDKDGGTGTDSLLLEVKPLVVKIDIKPDGYPNSINLKSKGNIPVALISGVYGGVNFDATTVDRVSLTFAGAPDLNIGKGSTDIDGDGDSDMAFHFDTPALRLTSTSTSASLTGRTADGIYFQGNDSVRIVPAGK